MKKIVVFIIFSVASSMIIAQEKEQNSKHFIGINTGSVTGIGLSYRFFPKKTGIQVTVAGFKRDSAWNDIMGIKDFYNGFDPFYLEEERPVYDEHGRPVYDEYGYPVYEDVEENIKFISIGIAFLRSIKELDDDKDIIMYVGNHYLENKTKGFYNAGIGIGLTSRTRIGYSFLLGYGAYDIFGDLVLFPTAEAGIFLKMK